jgi:hypothetical protein
MHHSNFFLTERDILKYKKNLRHAKNVEVFCFVKFFDFLHQSFVFVYVFVFLNLFTICDVRVLRCRRHLRDSLRPGSRGSSLAVEGSAFEGPG